MQSTLTSQKPTDRKITTTVSNKILTAKNDQISEQDSLLFWMGKYFEKIVDGSKDRTVEAKTKDLKRFLSFMSDEVGSDHIDLWTPSLTKHYQKTLLSQKSKTSGKPYKATTINRLFATIRHSARWISEHRPFSAGDPFQGVKELMIDEPDWNGLTNRQLTFIRGACDQRLKICNRKDQNPILEVAVFYTLLHTGMREFELCSLTVGQYYEKGFHDVKRKGRMISKRIFLPDEAQEKLDIYLKTREDLHDDDPLFTNRANSPLAERDVFRICERLSNQACVQLKEEDRFKLRPHQLRHTFLKRANDKYGLSYAKKVSGNVGIRELYRYTAPNQKEVEEKAESLFD
jgi:integrase/recombinase XerD